jgi:hypothetical protein
MQQLIASYLFQNKTCPLPGLGTLSIHTSSAQSDFTNQQIAAPAPVIEFSGAETNAADLLNYVAAKTNSNNYEATEALDHFCDNLKNEISQNAWAKLGSIGNFIVDNNGNIIFEQLALPAVFLQPVFAERVIHPKAEHHILVGDKETTNKMMAEYFNEETPVAKNRWWIWAIALGAIALLILLIYFTGTHNASAFGNAIKI